MKLTEAILNKVIKSMAIAVIGKLVIGSRKFLEALRGDAGEISGELCVLGKNHRTTSHKAVDQRLLAHVQTLTLTPNRNKKIFKGMCRKRKRKKAWEKERKTVRCEEQTK